MKRCVLFLVVFFMLPIPAVRAKSPTVGNALGVYDADATFLGYYVGQVGYNGLKVFHPKLSVGFILSISPGPPPTASATGASDYLQLDLFYVSADCTGTPYVLLSRPVLSEPETTPPFGLLFVLFEDHGHFYVVDKSRSVVDETRIQSCASFPERVCGSPPVWAVDQPVLVPLKKVSFPLGHQTIKYPLSIRPIGRDR